MPKAQFYGGIVGSPLQAPYPTPWVTIADFTTNTSAWQTRNAKLYWPTDLPESLADVPMCQIVFDMDATGHTDGTMYLQAQAGVYGLPVMPYGGPNAATPLTQGGYASSMWWAETITTYGFYQGRKLHRVNLIVKPSWLSPTQGGVATGSYSGLTSPLFWEIRVAGMYYGAIRNIKARMLYAENPHG